MTRPIEEREVGMSRRKHIRQGQRGEINNMEVEAKKKLEKLVVGGAESQIAVRV